MLHCSEVSHNIVPVKVMHVFNRCTWQMRGRKSLLSVLAVASLLVGFVPFFLMMGATPRDVFATIHRTARFSLDFMDGAFPTPRLPRSIDCNVLPPNFSASFRQLTRHSPTLLASCELLFKGDLDERNRVRRLMDSWNNSITDQQFLTDLSSDCAKTRQTFYDNFYTSRVEREFPLAYIFLVHHKEGAIQQYLRLLKVLYRPHNVYCIHLDAKSPIWWKILVEKFSKCFSNVIIASESIDVVYGTVKILHAHLSCFRELQRTQLPWRYAINLHGTELPLATNRELVHLTKNMNGVNIVDIGENITNSNASHVKRKLHLSVSWNVKGTKIYHRRSSNIHTPFNMTLFKGANSANSALTREFVDFMLTDERAKSLVHFLHDFESAVEFYFSTINHFPDAPGNAFLLKKGHRRPLLVHRIWNFRNSSRCLEGKWHHRICIVSVGDLPWLKSGMDSGNFYFMNKYWIEYDHVVMDCMEDLLVEKNVEEFSRDCTAVHNDIH